MKKKLIYRLWMLLCLMVLLKPVTADAITPLDPTRNCSLNIHYGAEGANFSGVTVQIYRVAAASPDGTFDLIEPFSGYPVNIHSITSQQEWRDTAATLVSYITAERVPATAQAVTNEAGIAAFPQLKTGLYLVLGSSHTNLERTYWFEDFLIYLPTPLNGGESFDYDMDAKPKPTGVTVYDQYTVRKLWKDSGNSGNRPREIYVDIFKNGELYETVTLNANNQWTYTWHTGSVGDRWTVLERDIPNGYTVTVGTQDNVFTITNSRNTPPSAPPKTGDTFPIWSCICVLAASGILLILLGLSQKRRK
ncbi:MAG: Cna B-type domain-containing protein [Oscillospiraceae bacterium]|nr:Cna B-type domain-containing protein [Oscillospiraceae bacterium]